MSEFGLEFDEVQMDVLGCSTESLSENKKLPYPHFRVNRIAYQNILESLESGTIPLIESSSGEVVAHINNNVRQILNLLYIYPELQWSESANSSEDCANISFLMQLVKMDVPKGVFDYV